jgi:chromosome segregation ATPase
MTTESLENEVRVLAAIEVAAARKEIEHIARQLEDIRKERMRLNRREAELLQQRLEARRRMAKADAVLK